MALIAFQRIETELAPGHKVIRYHQQGTDKRAGFELHATKDGISLSGASSVINTQADLQQLAKHVAIAWQEHQRLKYPQADEASE
jgi:hypothetical protein